MQTGRGAVGIALLGVAACSEPSRTAEDDSEPAADDTETPESGSGKATGGMSWSRVNLDFVSAYVLVRGKEAAVVDTGVGGSADAIGEVLDQAGPGWAGVRHVVLTHKHPDHAGSISDVLTEASSATGYIGQADLSEVDVEGGSACSADGDDVFGLQIARHPRPHRGAPVGLRPGHRGPGRRRRADNEGALAGSNPEFTEDMAAAVASVRKTGPACADGRSWSGTATRSSDGAAAALEHLASSLR